MGSTKQKSKQNEESESPLASGLPALLPDLNGHEHHSLQIWKAPGAHVGQHRDLQPLSSPEQPPLDILPAPPGWWGTTRGLAFHSHVGNKHWAAAAIGGGARMCHMCAMCAHRPLSPGKGLEVQMLGVAREKTGRESTRRGTKVHILRCWSWATLHAAPAPRSPPGAAQVPAHAFGLTVLRSQATLSLSEKNSAAPWL